MSGASRPRSRSTGTLAALRALIRAIPRGKVATYGQIAELAGFPRAARLTVRALYSGDGMPWHRVVAAGGRVALEGAGGREQRLRLRIEGVTFERGRVRMDRHAWSPSRHRRPSLAPARPRARATAKSAATNGLRIPFDGPRPARDLR